MTSGKNYFDAADYGIDSSYKSFSGAEVVVDPATIAKVHAAIARTDHEASSGKPRETYIVRRDTPSVVDMRTGNAPTSWRIEADKKIVARGDDSSGQLHIPALSLGVYRLHFEMTVAGRRAPLAANLIAAPEICFQGSSGGESRNWLLAVQLYGIRSRRNWGHGDFTDLSLLLEYAARWGAAGVGINPLHALFIDRAHDASPYSPNSRLFFNPLYIDLEALPEFPGRRALKLEGEIERLRASEHVDYPKVAQVKMTAFRAAYAAFCGRPDPARLKDFESFRAEHGASLLRFAAFETLRLRFNAPWWKWPEEWRKPEERTLAHLAESAADELRFHEYLQWIADRQLANCRQRAKQLKLGVGLYLDLAVGVAPDGADAWCDQDVMLSGLSIGAPPDVYNIEGQNWGLTSYSPTGLIRRGFEPYRRLLTSAMRYAGAIRIDHVFGLRRLYVIPQGHSAREGAYLNFPFEPMLAVAAEQSERHRCVVIGEDLGTAPENFREALERWGIYSYRVMYFERDDDGGLLSADRYPKRALVTFGTHDMATFAGWTTGHDLAVKQAIGVPPGETAEERLRAQAALRQAIESTKPNNDMEEEFIAIVRFLASTPSRLVSVSLEDIVGALDQPNMPGTVDQYPNWQKRLPVLVEDLDSREQTARISEAMQAASRGPAGRPS